MHSPYFLLPLAELTAWVSGIPEHIDLSGSISSLPEIDRVETQRLIYAECINTGILQNIKRPVSVGLIYQKALHTDHGTAHKRIFVKTFHGKREHFVFAGN